MTQAAYRVDGEVISVALLPHGAGPDDRPSDRSYVRATTAEGDTVLVMRSGDTSAKQSTEDDLQDIADGVADRLG